MDFAKDVVPIRIEDEMRNSYMDYSMSVIIGRALPDVRDGLKPVHRRILYAMDREGLAANKKYSKCAGVVGEVLKKYHPHGDSAVYDALVRMAQPWNLRYMLVDGQGNFGSVDGDPAAAYRYTECRMTKLAEEMLTDIDKETVTYSANFDGQVMEPDVLPSRFPNLLVNGADGIAVGMATKIPPHNLIEIINACILLMENPDVTLEEIMELVPGPDFPTGGTIYGRKGVRDAYSTGRGRVVVRGRAEFEELKNGRTAIIIDELPFQVNKARLIQLIADLVKDKRIDGIHALRDESDRRGMRVVIELKHDAFPEVVLNHLYKHTPLQNTFGVILLAIVNKRPRVLTLHEMLSHYISHRRDVILRRTRYLLRKARERAHILEGFKIALDWLDEVIKLIRGSANAGEARVGLMGRFDLTEIQANAILEMRLQRLTGMERQKILEELQSVLATISELEDILGSELRLMNVVREELIEVRDKYGDDRRTRIVDDLGELSIHDLVAEEDHIVTVSHLGYIKRVHPDEWRAQKRGGMGKKGMATREEDYVTSIFVANTHNTLMVFTTSGKVYPLPVYQVPETSRTAKGKPIINLVPVQKDEKITAVVSVPEISEESETELLFVSRNGLVKRTALSDYRNIRTGGLIACGVADDDELQIVKEIPHETELDVMIFSAKGQSIRFKRVSDEDKSNGVPSYGRTARGNKGIALDPGDFVVEALFVPSERTKPGEDEEMIDNETAALLPSVLTVTALGYGKRNAFEHWGVQNRNGKGVIGHKLSDKTGDLAGALVVEPTDHLMIVTDTGRIIRFEADSVSTYSRSTQGVRLMRLEEDERIVDVTRIEEEEEEDELEEGAEASDSAEGESAESEGAEEAAVAEQPASEDESEGSESSES